MAIAATQMQPTDDGAATIATLAVSKGCAQHRYVRQLTAPNAAARDVADAVHAICAVHGRTTDLFELAARCPGPDLDPRWLSDAASAFVEERAYLVAMTAAVGPLPSTPRQADSDSAFAALRHAFDILATSGRTGCAAGAAIALMIDWQTFRTVLDTAADHLGVEAPSMELPDEAAIAEICTAVTATPAVNRAMCFGARQTFTQHHTLFDLIEARATARDRH